MQKLTTGEVRKVAVEKYGLQTADLDAALDEGEELRMDPKDSLILAILKRKRAPFGSLCGGQGLQLVGVEVPTLAGTPQKQAMYVAANSARNRAFKSEPKGALQREAVQTLLDRTVQDGVRKSKQSAKKNKARKLAKAKAKAKVGKIVQNECEGTTVESGGTKVQHQQSQHLHRHRLEERLTKKLQAIDKKLQAATSEAAELASAAAAPQLSKVVSGGPDAVIAVGRSAAARAKREGAAGAQAAAQRAPSKGAAEALSQYLRRLVPSPLTTTPTATMTTKSKSDSSSSGAANAAVRIAQRNLSLGSSTVDEESDEANEAAALEQLLHEISCGVDDGGNLGTSDSLEVARLYQERSLLLSGKVGVRAALERAGVPALFYKVERRRHPVSLLVTRCHLPATYNYVVLNLHKVIQPWVRWRLTCVGARAAAVAAAQHYAAWYTARRNVSSAGASNALIDAVSPNGGGDGCGGGAVEAAIVANIFPLPPNPLYPSDIHAMEWDL